jgi:tRNA A37 methylthiotransferase MiaB
MTMTPDDKKELIETMTAVFTATGQDHADQIKEAIKDHESTDHHQYIKVKIEAEKRRAQMWQNAKGNVLSYLIIGVIGGSLALVALGLKSKLGL